MQIPISLKMSATWENEKSSSSIVPRICNLSITQVLFDRIIDEKIENNQFFYVTVRMRDSSRRVLRSPELAFPLEIPGVVNLNFHCSIQYSHALKRDSSNLLQLLIQRKKKYKKKPVNFGYKTLAYCTIDLAQVLQRKIENRMLDLYEDPKSLSHSVGRIEVQSLTSTPAEKVMLCERRKEFYEEDDEGIPDQFSEDSDHGEDSDFDPNCAEFGESRQKKIMKAMAVGANNTSTHRRSSSPSAALPEWQKQIKQKIMGLLKKVKLMEHNEVPDPRDRWWDELDQFENISDESELGELDSLSIQSTPRPMLKPFFNRNTLGVPQNTSSNTANNLGSVGGQNLNGHLAADQTSSEDTLNKDGAAKLFKKLQLTNTYGTDNTVPLDNNILQDDDHQNASSNTPIGMSTTPSQTFQVTSVSNSNVPNTYSGGGGGRSFSIMKKYHSSTGVVSTNPLMASSAGAHSSTTTVNHPIPASTTHFFTDNILSTTSTSIPSVNPACITSENFTTLSSTCTPTSINPNTGLDSTGQQGSKHKSAVSTTMPNNASAYPGGISAISVNSMNQKQKKIPPISGIMKTLSLSSNTNGEHFMDPNSASNSLNDSGGGLGISGGLSPSPSQQLHHPLHGNTAQPNEYAVSTTTSSPISGLYGTNNTTGPFTQCNEFIQMQVPTNIHDLHPRPELIEQTEEFMNTLGNEPDSTNIIYLISLSDVGGKYVSDLFKKEYTPHLNLASYADTKYAFTQIINKMRKRKRILKLCLLGGDCHLNNVLRAFIYQMNENYSTDVLSKFRFFIIPIIGLYLASSNTPFPGISISGVSATSNTMARRLCSLDSRYNSLFSEFLQTETPTLSTDSGSERDNKFLFGVHDYLQAGSSVVNCPIGECLVSTKDKQNILQDLESNKYNEAFIPFITEIRIGGDIPISSLSSTPMLQDVNTSLVNSSGVAVSSNSAVLGRMDSSANEEQLLAMMSNASSPPRSPAITVTSGFDGSGRYPMHHHHHHHIPLTTSSSMHQQQSASLPSPAVIAPSHSSSNTLPQSGPTSIVTQPSTTPLTSVPAPVSTTHNPGLSSSPLASSAPLPGNNPEMQLEYWSGDHSSSKKLNIKTVPLRQVLVHPNLNDSHHLSLTILTKEKKQKIMRIAKKTKHETGDTKKEILDDINQIFCTSKNQSSEIKVIIDGVVWSNVHFFQIGPSWRTNIKSFPIATFT